MESKYEKTKESIMLWRANNLDKYREQQRLYQRNYYKNNYEKVRKVQKQKTYILKKELRRFLNILLPPL
tara:strand:+ start:573 stop:779 length:207 start_codon:yes stop_codon:yes gene_type:complete